VASAIGSHESIVMRSGKKKSLRCLGERWYRMRSLAATENRSAQRAEGNGAK
jgi:hypothetical protein